MRPAERWGLVAAVVARFMLGALRFAGAPDRFVNREEAHNATSAWLFGHGELLGEVTRVQYREFCGGCSVVALLGAPLLATGDTLWRWKLLALGITGAIQVAGFFALRATTVPAAAWAWLLLSVVPPVGALDLSLMLWGNHQESALPVLLALWAYGRGATLWSGLALGFGVYFARTSAYAALVLLPLGFRGGPRPGLLGLLGFALGLAPAFLPAAGGDAGWYRFGEALVPTVEKIGDRAATLFLPDALAARAWLPVRSPSLLGWGWLGLVTASAALLLVARRGRVLLGLAGAWALAYTFTSFPIFLVNARVPVNNIRYHAPWLLVSTLLLAAGFGVAWSRGWRRTAGAGLAAVLLGNAWALVPQLRPPHPTASTLPATDAAGFVTTVAARFPDRSPFADSSAPSPILMRLHGITAARLGEPAPSDDATVLGGYGEALVDPCDGAPAIAAALLALPEAQRLPVGRGMGLTLSFCPRAAKEEGDLITALDAAVACAPCSLGGRRRLDDCGGPAETDTPALAGCVASALDGLPESTRHELAFGVGRAWVDTLRPPSARARFVEAFAAAPGLASAVAQGVDDPAGGSRQPALARDRPAGPPPR